MTQHARSTPEATWRDAGGPVSPAPEISARVLSARWERCESRPIPRLDGTHRPAEIYRLTVGLPYEVAVAQGGDPVEWWVHIGRGDVHPRAYASRNAAQIAAERWASRPHLAACRDVECACPGHDWEAR